MLAFYQRWAHRLYPWRMLFILLFVCSVLSFVWLLFAAPDELAKRWQLASVLLAICGLFFWLWATLFRHPLAEISAEPRFGQRLKLRLQHGVYYLLTLIITLLLIAISYLGLRIAKGIIADLFFS